MFRDNRFIIVRQIIYLRSAPALYYNIFNMEKLYRIYTYGCQMNVHDSEKIAGILRNLGYRATNIAENADIIVFNTCCIRKSAETKIMGNIGAVKSLKVANPNLIVAVTGCMTQQEGVAEILKKRYPFIDIILGTVNLIRLPEALSALQNKHSFIEISHETNPPIEEGVPAYRTSGTNAWVDIMYGCDNFCTYCIVPYVRGRERSRRPDAVINEVKSLTDKGYREITLLGQNVDSYNCDGIKFAYLLRKIAEIDGKFRLRFISSHPKDFNEEIIDIVAGSKNICHSVHLPLQSGSDRILSLMNRKYTRERYLELILAIRRALPDCGITTDIMVGFPTETEKDFEDTLSLVREVRFENAFMFVYSPRKGTVAEKAEQLPAEVKKERITELVRVQNEITASESKKYIGRTEEILVESINPEYPGLIRGRTDSGRLVNFEGDKNKIGDFVNVKITSAKSSALRGTIDG